MLTDAKLPVRGYGFHSIFMHSYVLQKQGVEIMSVPLSLDIDLINLLQIASSEKHVFPTVSSEFLGYLKEIDGTPCKYWDLLHRYDCFIVEYATHRFHMKLHPGYK